MDITLHMLNGYLLASKAYLNSYLKETADQDIKPSPSNAMAALAGQTETMEVTREELKNALLSAQVRLSLYKCYNGLASCVLTL